MWTHRLARGVTGLAAAVFLASSSLTLAGPVQEVAAQQSSMDIVETARSAGQFSTLLTAAQEAGLVDTLQSEAPFTVFAPSDAAFEKLPEGTVEALLQNEDQLRSILTYHVVPDSLTADEVTSRDTLTTVQGEPLNVRTSGNQVMINDATVTTANIQASNGVIHVIDSVLMPPSVSPQMMPKSGGAGVEWAPLVAAASGLVLVGGLVLRRARAAIPAR